MKSLLIISAMFLLISGNALAGREYDRCIKTEMELKSQETSQCSGLKYLLNPSACFATQRILKEYKAGKCTQIGINENVDFSAQPVIPEKKGSSTGSVNQRKVETEVPLQEGTTEQLKAENSRLRAEIIRLKAENEQLKKAVK